MTTSQGATILWILLALTPAAAADLGFCGWPGTRLPRFPVTAATVAKSLEFNAIGRAGARAVRRAALDILGVAGPRSD